MTAHDDQHSAAAEGVLMAQWLHDQVVPSLMAAGLWVELARPACPPEAVAHLDRVAQILEGLNRTVREEMVRRAGGPTVQ